MAWYNRSGETFFKVSFDRGNPWEKYQQDFYGPGRFVANEQGNLYCLEDQPPTNLQVASDNNGRFHCVWNIETDFGDNWDHTLMTDSFDLPLPGGNN